MDVKGAKEILALAKHRRAQGNQDAIEQLKATGVREAFKESADSHLSWCKMFFVGNTLEHCDCGIDGRKVAFAKLNALLGEKP